jgi:phosphatidylcholine synthase
LLPEAWTLIGASLIVLTSGYQFCQMDAKTADHFFKGFPSYWNVLAYYLLLLQLDPWINLTTILVCGLLVFIPIKFIYPSRMSRYQKLTLIVTAVWCLMNLVVIFQYPNYSLTLLRLSLLYIVYYVGISFYMASQASKRMKNNAYLEMSNEVGYDNFESDTHI